MEGNKKCSYLTHLQLYQRDRPVLEFPGRSLLCCPATGAQDLQRYKSKGSSGDSRGQQPPTAKCTRWTLQDRASIGKYGGKHEVRQRQGKRNKEQAVLCVTDCIYHTLLTPLSPYSICLPRLWQGCPPTSHRESVQTVCDLCFSFPCSLQSQGLHWPFTFHHYQPTFLQNQGFFIHPSAKPAVSLSSQFNRILCELVVLPPPSSNDV